MNQVYALAQNRWIGPGILLATSLSLPVLFQNSELFWAIAILGTATAGWGVAVPNRWLIALVGAFTAGLVAFSLRSAGGIEATMAFPLVFLIGTVLTLWLLPTRNAVDVVLGYAGGIALLELFLILAFWPINYPSRALLLTAGAFLLFELIERRQTRARWTSFFGSVSIAVVAVAAIILTADWYSF